MAKRQESPSKILSDAIVKALKEKKGTAITRLDLRNINGAVSEFFVVATGSSDRHVQALADNVIEKVRETLNEKPHSKEGVRLGEWVLLDYVTVVVHLFQEDKREFYSIEELWGDATREDFDKKAGEENRKVEVESKKAGSESRKVGKAKVVKRKTT